MYNIAYTYYIHVLHLYVPIYSMRSSDRFCRLSPAGPRTLLNPYLVQDGQTTKTIAVILLACLVFRVVKQHVFSYVHSPFLQQCEITARSLTVGFSLTQKYLSRLNF